MYYIKDGRKQPISDELRQATVAHYQKAAGDEPDVTGARADPEPGCIIIVAKGGERKFRYMDDGEVITIYPPLGECMEVPREDFLQQVGYGQSPG